MIQMHTIVDIHQEHAKNCDAVLRQRLNAVRRARKAWGRGPSELQCATAAAVGLSAESPSKINIHKKTKSERPLTTRLDLITYLPV